MAASADKDFCCSSYLAFRYIEKDGAEFFPELTHKNAVLPSEEEVTLVKNSEEIDIAIRKTFDQLKGEKLGILLSGGMDSACLASYMGGCDAYTFRFTDGTQGEELRRAEKYADTYGLKLHYVDISPSDLIRYLPPVMVNRECPVHSIEPQIYKAACIAKQDGITTMIIGDGADYVFYGMDKLLAEDWSFDGFVKRYMYIDPKTVLKNPADVNYLFERYRQGDGIDFVGFMTIIATEESYGSYKNAFETADLAYVDPYEKLKMAEPLDLERTRAGESKYWIRDLFRMKYPEIPVPEKHPMPRPVDKLFADWNGPGRPEFLENIDMSRLTGNQKWQLYCLEAFLNLYDPVL